MAVPEITTLPPAPSRTRPSEFSSEADLFLSALPDFGDECNILADFCEVQAGDAETTKGETETVKSETESVRDEAIDAQQAAEDARDAAQSISDYKGGWDTLSGALSIPASVYHEGSYWLLISNLADVTAQEPEESSIYWSMVYNGRYNFNEFATNFSPEAGKCYIVTSTSGDLSVTLPASYNTNDWIEFKCYLSSGCRILIYPNGSNIESLGETFEIESDFNNISFRFVASGTARGWILV